MVTITLTPELESVISKRAENEGVTPERYALNSLNERFLPPPPVEAAPNAPTLEEKIAALVAAVPEEEWAKLPADMGDNLDHYIYGTAKGQ